MNVSTAEVCRLLDDANDTVMECHRQIEILKAERVELLAALKALREPVAVPEPRYPVKVRRMCRYCGEAKVEGEPCPGCDQCIYGPNGGPAEACEGWGRYCCKCGADFARGQM